MQMQILKAREDEQYGFTHLMYKQSAGYFCGNAHWIRRHGEDDNRDTQIWPIFE